jgi:hypothetical protein
MEKTIDLGLPLPADAPLNWRAVLDAERLLRLHPHWHVEAIQGDADRVRARLKDHATDAVFDFAFGLTFPGPHEFVITPAGGPLTAIRFFTRNERVHVAVTTAVARLADAEEQNLTLWLQSIRQYLRLYLCTTPNTLFFRWLMNRALLRMNPSQRKICMMIYRFTVLEVVVILIILIGYFTLGR